MRPPFTTLILHTWKEHGKPKPWKKWFLDTEEEEEEDSEKGRVGTQTTESTSSYHSPYSLKVVRSVSLDQLSSKKYSPVFPLDAKDDTNHFIRKSRSYTEGLSCTVEESHHLKKHLPVRKKIEESFEKSPPLIGVARKSRSFHEGLVAKREPCFGKPPCYSPTFWKERLKTCEEVQSEYRKFRCNNINTFSSTQSVTPSF
ncbi:hypothetical protein GpartN1_g7677.t1 [Galdieria partita]|uniref:Uncharacterized protein n=1 Tax=Galdieria partita TaxID=83374 RepID=A0A9C7Q6X6_9RHOD|nr:hypothetical protein GpartN1_g7677.t1 [Galdieria partita]